MFEIKGNSAMKRIAMNRRFRQRLQGFCSRRTRSIQKLRHRSFHGLDFRFKFFPELFARNETSTTLPSPRPKAQARTITNPAHFGITNEANAVTTAMTASSQPDPDQI